MTRIAVLGTGRMGAAIARRLLAAGSTVTAWNRTPDRTAELTELGATAAATPGRAAHGADIVITMLADAEAVTRVITGADGIAESIGEHAVLMQMSTIGPHATRELAARLPAAVTMLDAPVKGSVPQALDGALTVFAGGSATALDRACPALSAIGSVVHCGDIGTASAVKLMVNAAMIASVTALAEVMAVADALGVPEDLARDQLTAGPLVGALARADATGARFPIRLAGKDIDLAIADADLPVLRAVGDRLAAVSGERADADLADILGHIRHQQGD